MKLKKTLFIAPFLIAILAVWWVFFRANGGDSGTEVKVIVPKGSTVASVTDSLYAHGLIRSKLSFGTAARVLRAGGKIHAGLFRVAYGLSNAQVIKRLTGTEYALILTATFPEGITIRRLAQIARDKLKLDSAQMMKAISDRTLLDSLGIPKEAKTAEGYLFPDTYQFLFSVDPTSLVTRMSARWKQIVTDSLKKEIVKTGLSLHEFMTLASIVESEARRADERDTIAGVYWNRLKIGMKLDADPTVQYGLKLSRPITHEDLQINTPYNTYMNNGLPPGPINCPGAAAINATLHPARHDKLYFVARRDGSGGHYFSHSIADQSKMIAQARRNASDSE